MKILIAIDSFKGSLSSGQLSEAISEGIINVMPDAEILKTPIADGGEGVVDALVEKLNGSLIYKTVKGPLFQAIEAHYGILPDKTAIIEMALCSGLTLIPETHRNPLNTSTYGVGELILDALDKGSRDFVCGIGGSATNDAGIGMAAALRYTFYDENNQELIPVGSSLNLIQRIDNTNVDPRLSECTFLIACDVDNPLYGPRGAAYTYGPQKGADEKTVQLLDEGLKHFSSIVKRDLHIDKADLSGAGAAGGLGYGFSVLLNGELKPGIEIMLEKLEFEEKLDGVDLVITGEGKIDFQSVMGKTPMGVGLTSKKHNIPVIAIAGALGDNYHALNDYGIDSIFSVLNKPCTLEEAMNPTNAYKNVKDTIQEIFKMIKIYKK